jgi:leader peptidase (prepilin peptidase)/N-methyltransferase
MQLATGLPLALLVGAAGGLGLLVGSFLNVVIHRLPRGESLAWPGSRCPACGTPIRWRDNVPVLSYLLLRGRCRSCAARISPRYPAVEAVTAMLFVALALRHGTGPMLPLWWAFGAALVATAVIDFDHQIIPDEISLGGLLVALVAVPAAQAYSGADFLAVLSRSVAGALLGGGLFWCVGFAHARVSAALGRQFAHWPGEGESLPTPGSVDYWVWFPGVGFGDVKLLAMIGAVLGPMGVLWTILAASVAGLLLGLGFALVTREWNAPFGFAPAIAVGAVLVALLPGAASWPFA